MRPSRVASADGSAAEDDHDNTFAVTMLTSRDDWTGVFAAGVEPSDVYRMTAPGLVVENVLLPITAPAF